MLSADDRQVLSHLMERAGLKALDMRAMDRDALVRQTVSIGPFRIAFAHELMPPDWRAWRHLSVSENGGPPQDAAFMAIAEAVGMGDKTQWNESLTNLLAHLGAPMRARHAFSPPSA